MVRPGAWIVLTFVLMPTSMAEPQVLVPAAAQAESDNAWTLDAVIAAVVARNPLVEAARARMNAAREERSTVSAIPNPAVTLWLENAPYPGQRRPPDFAQETSFYLTYPLEPFVQRASRVRRADEEVKAATAEFTHTQRTVIAETVRAFFGVALAQALHEQALDAHRRWEQLEAYTQARVGEGITAEGELLRVQVEVDRARNEIVMAEVELARHRSRLAPYVGVVVASAPEAALRVTVPLPDTSTLSWLPALDDVMAIALERRPEIVSTRARISAAAAEIDYQRSLALRQLGATFGNKRADGMNSMVAGVSLTVPLFNRNTSSVRRAASERVAVENELGWAERLVAAEVQTAFGVASRLTTHVRELPRTLLARAEVVYRLTVAAYQEGGVPLLQVLDATRVMAEARLASSRLHFAQRESLLQLALATGADPSDALDLLQRWSAPPATARAGRATP